MCNTMCRPTSVILHWAVQTSATRWFCSTRHHACALRFHPCMMSHPRDTQREVALTNVGSLHWCAPTSHASLKRSLKVCTRAASLSAGPTLPVCYICLTVMYHQQQQHQHTHTNQYTDVMLTTQPSDHTLCTMNQSTTTRYKSTFEGNFAITSQHGV